MSAWSDATGARRPELRRSREPPARPWPPRPATAQPRTRAERDRPSGGPPAARPPSRRRQSSPDLPTRDRPRHHEALDLGGALEDRVDLRVAVHPLHRELARVAVPTEDLDRPLGRPHRHLAGLELGHRALGVLERA